MNTDSARNSPILWMAIILLALCIAGTLAVVVISAVKGADELPAVYHSEGSAADRDLLALTAARDRALGARLTIAGREVVVDFRAAAGSAPEENTLSLRLTHATRDGHDNITTLFKSGQRFVGAVNAPLTAGAWLVELRPPSADWLLRGRIASTGGRVGDAPP